KRPQISSSTSPLELDEIQQILGNRRITSLNDIGHYTQYCHTWEWDDRFWFSLTSAQRDQLNRLQQQLQQSRSRQDSGDTQIYEHSDRSAYQGDSEDNTPKTNNLNRRIRSRNSSQDNLLPLPINQTPTDETKRFKAITNEPGST
ncbi:unnamed protein product, partial [Adineta steineri]